MRVTVVMAVEVETDGKLPAQEIGQSIIGRVSLPDRFANVVHNVELRPTAIGLMSVHEGVPLVEEEEG